MYRFTSRQKAAALLWLSLFHILIITSSNYLVQLPISIFWLPYHMGCIYFSIYFLSDRFNCSYLWGPSGKTHYYCRYDTGISYFLPNINTLFPRGSWQGFASLNDFNIMVARIATAKLLWRMCVRANYGCFCLFNRFKTATKMVGCTKCSDVFGNFLDTVAFFFCAFYREYRCVYGGQLGRNSARGLHF